MNKLKFTLKAWPVIAIATIGLCFLTKTVAGWFGIDLPDQQNVELVRAWLMHTFDSGKKFLAVAILLFQIVILMPALEELIFRGILFKWPGPKRVWLPAVTSSLLFSAAHYIVQPWPDAAFLALFFFGLAQCWLYLKTCRIWCAMFNHLLFNLTNLVLLLIVPA